LELASKNAAIGIIAAGALVGWFACKAKKIRQQNQPFYYLLDQIFHPNWYLPLGSTVQPTVGNAGETQSS
jgi:hypothetical protein